MTSATSNMDVALKDKGIIVDMSPAAMINHNALAAHTLCSLQESSQDNATQSDVSRRCSISPTNLTTQSSNVTTFRCERCDNFETNSRASLLLHVVQCLASSGRLKIEDQQDGENNNNNVSNNVAGTQVETIVAKLPLPEIQPPKSVTPTSVIVSVAKGSINSTPATSSTSSASSPSSGRKVFECDVCNMKFSNGANMRRHKMRHTGVKPYECRVCQKRFFRKDHLAEHFTTHTKTLPYHCPICNRGFQRQIAMRAHFQNEHVGQHDLVKTCPLCSYRAGSMKSLRIHFFNRHGIDLDNPGPGGTSSLLLALESQATQVAAAAAAAGFVANLNAAAAASASNNINQTNGTATSHHSDSGESMRSNDNGTPPMHFLTPHVEISTAAENGSDAFNGNGINEATDSKMKERDFVIQSPVPPVQDQPLDCNTKSVPSSTSNGLNVQLSVSPKSHHHENHITPSISLIPIKQQEPQGEDLSSDMKNGYKISKPNEQTNGSDNNETEYSSPNNRMTSLIKVSPLKSLLREDLKRRICAKANNRITRNAAALENNNILQNPITVNNATNANSTPICNGTITSTGQEPEAPMLNRKQILTCLFCGIEFPDETLYFLHKGCHCESNPWKCNICGEQCNNVYEFNSHLLSKSHQ